MTWRNWWRGLVTRVSNGVKDLVQAHWLCTLKETMIFEFLLGWAMRIWTIQYGSDILACVEFRSRSRCVCRSRILSGEGSRKAGLGTYLTCTFLQYCNVFSIGGIYLRETEMFPSLKGLTPVGTLVDRKMPRLEVQWREPSCLSGTETSPGTSWSSTLSPVELLPLRPSSSATWFKFTVQLRSVEIVCYLSPLHKLLVHGFAKLVWTLLVDRYRWNSSALWTIVFSMMNCMLQSS